MIIYSKNEFHNNVSPLIKPQKKLSVTKIPISNDVRIQYKKNIPKQEPTFIVQRQIVYYNTKTEITVSNLQELNDYFSFIGTGINVNYSNFTQMHPADVDQALSLLEDADVNSMTTAKELIDKITEIYTNYLNGLKTRLYKKWTVSNKGNNKTIKQGGDFIGDASGWHVHTNIGTQEHLKRGKGARCPTNNPDDINEAVKWLISNGGLNDPYGQECYRWLRYTIIERHNQDLSPELRFD